MGSPRIDGQHKHLFGLLDELRDAMAKGRGRDVASTVALKLETYARTHFALEEELLAAARYPHLATHLGEHAAFTARVRELSQAIRAGAPTATIDTMTFLSAWLVDHVRASDRRYLPFLERAGLL